MKFIVYHKDGCEYGIRADQVVSYWLKPRSENGQGLLRIYVMNGDYITIDETDEILEVCRQLIANA